ncbi:hypothetical protein L2U69_03410 [Zavarzinia compransoris]|uniref:hypothetical protein n=1 Tax=Zavarzinia marina TaxID=2911065 RepID=UPI001F1DB4F2|nr:hypothetical protein [Zavarzinia marina]MCF4164690.1 hypothetical protein [Zavarzinia marina]
MTLADFILRPIGFFYLVTAFLTIRAIVVGGFLDRALAAMNAGGPTRAGRLRQWWLVVATVLIAIGGAALMLLWEGAIVLFLINAAAQAFYLFVAAPRWFDPGDPPNPLGRVASQRALVIYLASTLLVLTAGLQGELLPFSALTPFGLTVTALMLVFGLQRPIRQHLAAVSVAPVETVVTPSGPADPGLGDEIPPPPLPARIVLTPSFTGSGVRDDESGEDVPLHVLQAHLPFDLCQRIDDWVFQFTEVADRDDPRRCSVKNDVAWDRMVSEGEAIFGQMVRRLGPDRVHFMPMPSPVEPAVEIGDRLELGVRHLAWPTWDQLPDGEVEVAPADLGLSYGLVQDLGAWATAYDDGVDAETGGPPRWTPERKAAHDSAGEILAARLRRELAATGRGNVEVVFRPA